jgi:Family of unknown function (DUF6152)
MKSTFIKVSLSVMLLLGYPALAHHSFPATYLVDKETEITGEVAAFLYRNPHASIQIMVTSENGERIRYLIEWAGAGTLAGSGVNRGTLVAGDVVKIHGNPGRNESDHRMRLVGITRPADGWTWGQEYD